MEASDRMAAVGEDEQQESSKGEEAVDEPTLSGLGAFLLLLKINWGIGVCL